MRFEPGHSNSYTIICSPSEDSDQPTHPPIPINLHCAFYDLSFFMQIVNADAQADLRLRRAHMSFCTRLILSVYIFIAGN